MNISRILRTLKINFKVLKGEITKIKEDIKISKKWFGNEYGGFYVALDKLNTNSIIYSFGIGEDNSFDDGLIQKYNCKVYAFDPTPRSITWVRNNVKNPNFIFSTYGIDNKTGMVKFLLPKNDNHISGSVISQINVDENKVIEVFMKSFNDIIKEFGHQKIDVLKIDIEGSEYKVIESIVNCPIEIDQILVEIHERFFDDGKQKTKNLLNFMSSKGYKIFGVSDIMEEISFIKN